MSVGVIISRSCLLFALNQIMAVKKKIEEIEGKDSYPWGQQMLIYKGKVLKDESTLDENEVTEDDMLVVMLSKVGCLYALYIRNCFSSVLCFGLFCVVECLV
jgi:UV excision repair protein RAD23